MSRPAVFLFAFVALAILAFFCIRVNGPAIETDLVSRTGSALALAGMDWAEVTSDGRDITLTGTAPTPELQVQAYETALKTYGVRSVENLLAIGEEAAQSSVPSPSAMDCRAMINEIISTRPIEFATASAIVDEDSKDLLDSLLSSSRDCSDIRFEIAGHSDSRGPETYNMDLGKQRARAVSDYLESRGMEPGRLSVKSYGESRPLADNSTPEGRSRNRRVEIYFMEE